MEISEATRGHITVIGLSGDILGRADEPNQFRKKIAQLVAKRQVRVVVNLSQVKLISSVGIGMLIAGSKALSDNGGMMVLADPSDPIKPVFRVLKGPITQFATEDEAVTYIEAHAGDEHS